MKYETKLTCKGEAMRLRRATKNCAPGLYRKQASHAKLQWYDCAMQQGMAKKWYPDLDMRTKLRDTGETRMRF